MIEFVFEVVGELLLQIAVEVLVELGFHSLAEPFRRPPNPWIAAFGYTIFGMIAGGISLFLFPSYLVEGAWKTVNLVVTPVVVGVLMCVLGWWRSKRGEEVLRIDRFTYGYLFALSFALIRFWFAK
ncbi:hypothetical protein D3870_17705 [Noviherbaspirillum cavernae]|uniref:Uncharacterized protein n=1 Tax=Noviherbaspirillum cavernae TaxID=2320862 RepID=A0A418X532_9BURK|nr:hypothetical protein [Noviherbaspirillum cavernae]RJG07584.1 hypothetical protein D3870_17705 [Noviherbaspirillum cavernae]